MVACDVLIAGGGIAGASLAAMLATRTDLDVIVLEASDRLGGRARSVSFAGARIDYGLHALLLGKSSSLFRMDRACHRGIRVTPLGASIYRNERLERLFGRHVLSSLTTEGFEASNLIALLSRLMLSDQRKQTHRMSLEALCDRYRASDKVRDLFRCLSIGLVVNPDFHRVSAGELLDYLLLSTRRFALAGYPEGGWETIWKRFGDLLEGKPGRLRLKERLLHIQLEDGRVTGCESDRETYRPKKLVLALPPPVLLKPGLLPPDALGPDTVTRLQDCRMTFGLNVDLLIEGGTVPQDMIFTIDPPTLAIAPTAASPNLVGAGRHVLTIFTPLGTVPESTARPNQQAEALIDLYDRIVPDLKNRIRDRMVNVLPVTGAEVTVESNVIDRPRIAAAGRPDLFLIGDWVRCPGVGGERAFASALQCFGHILRSLSAA